MACHDAVLAECAALRGGSAHRRPRAHVTSPPSAAASIPGRAFLAIGVLAVVWGCNWPLLKLGVTEIAPLTFRALTLGPAAIALLLLARASRHPLSVPRLLWPKLLVLALLNITLWNALVLFGLRQLPAGRWLGSA